MCGVACDKWDAAKNGKLGKLNRCSLRAMVDVCCLSEAACVITTVKLRQAGQGLDSGYDSTRFQSRSLDDMNYSQVGLEFYDLIRLN